MTCSLVDGVYVLGLGTEVSVKGRGKLLCIGDNNYQILQVEPCVGLSAWQVKYLSRGNESTAILS